MYPIYFWLLWLQLVSSVLTQMQTYPDFTSYPPFGHWRSAFYEKSSQDHPHFGSSYLRPIKPHPDFPTYLPLSDSRSQNDPHFPSDFTPHQPPDFPPRPAPGLPHTDWHNILYSRSNHVESPCQSCSPWCGSRCNKYCSEPEIHGECCTKERVLIAKMERLHDSLQGEFRARIRSKQGHFFGGMHK